MKKEVSRKYLMGLSKNVYNALDKKYLKKWINSTTNNMVQLSNKEYDLLKLIEKGGIKPEKFHYKN